MLTKLLVRGRLAQLEESNAQILSLLAKRTEPQPEPQPEPPRNGLQLPEVVEEVDTGIPTPAESTIPATARHEVAILLDAGLEEHLRTYRRMSAENFPFVIVPEQTSAALLSQRRPLLARAIAIVASWSSPNEQSARRALFLHELSSRFFIKNERSLDLLQALLVYFAWYVYCIQAFARALDPSMQAVERLLFAGSGTPWTCLCRQLDALLSTTTLTKVNF